ncbi:hypothetical protein Tco_1004460 [Tanacetum coccineum]|uniref:Uncharacterized protein n=1 Tax=Tanacetum coccineum TaxID=301880 RepID=A0ABQ5FDW2_9ASTR
MALMVKFISRSGGDDAKAAIPFCLCAALRDRQKTSSNTRNKNVDTSPRTRNDRKTKQFVNQRTVTVAGNMETIGNQPDEHELKAHYMYTTKIQEVLRTTDNNSGPTYDAEPLEKVDTYDEYNVFATETQHSEQPGSINDTYMVEKVDSNINPDSSYMCDNKGKADQNAKEPKDERVLLASLIANLKLDVDENKMIQKQLKKANKTLT